jgi:hypothetical protein
MLKPVLAMAAFLSVVSCARPSDAQSGWTDHARFSVNFGAQPSSSTFSATTNIPIGEQIATLTSNYSVPSGQFFDGGVILRVSGGFGLEIAASWFTKSQTASISGSIPHPLVFNRPRPISGTSPPLERDEITGYLDAAYVFSAGPVDLAVSGGPAFFTVSQDLVSNVTYTEAPPFDSVAFTGAVVTKAMATNLGFNAGVDIGVKLSKNIGVGALVRYSRASVTFPLANTASGVRADVGGTQAGGGVRVYF